MEKPRIIAMCGTARVGKDTAAKMICDLVPGTRTLAFAEPMKQIVRDLFGWTTEHTDGALKETPDERYPRRWISERDIDDGQFSTSVGRYEYLTPRFALQTLGTEFGRACYRDVWVDYALRQAARWIVDRNADVADGLDPLGSSPGGSLGGASLVVITDCRFVNEAAAVKKAGGVVWRLYRPDAEGAQGGIGGHASEAEAYSAAMDEFVDADLRNDGDLVTLRNVVRDALYGEGWEVGP
jgi:hypothetical protein